MSSENNSQDNKVFIGNLPFKYTEDDLKTKFSNNDSKAVEATIIRYRGYSKGYGFITYEDKEQAEKAVAAFNNTEHEDRKITLDLADEQNRPKANRNRGRGRGRGRGGIKNKKSSSDKKETPESKEETKDTTKEEKKSNLLEPRKFDDFEDSNAENEEVNYDEVKRIDDDKPERKTRPRSRGGYNRGRFQPRFRKSDRPRTVSENTVYISQIPFSVKTSQQLIEHVPEEYKELVAHAKIAKRPIVKNKITDDAAIDEEIELLSKGFGFLQFKDPEDCKKFLQDYGVKNKQSKGIFIGSRKLFIAESSLDLTKTS